MPPRSFPTEIGRSEVEPENGERQFDAGAFEVAPGIGFRLEGRGVLAYNDASPEAFAAFLAQQAAFRQRIPALIAEHVEEITTILSRLPTLQLLANEAMTHHTGDPETYQESETRPYLTLEYITWLALTSLEAPIDAFEVISGEDARSIEQHLEAATSLAFWRAMTDHLTRGLAEPTALDTLRFNTRTRHMVVRFPGYEQHLREQIRGLFSAFDDDLRASLGFDVSTAIALAGALEAHVNAELGDHQRRVREAADRWRRVAAGEVDDATEDEREAVRNWAAVEPNERDIQIPYAIHSWAIFRAQVAYTVTPLQLADRAGVSEEVAAAFLHEFSLSFGQKPIAQSEPASYEPQQRRPLIDLGDGTWFAHLPAHVLWAIRPRLEHALTGNPTTRERYLRERGVYLEERTTGLIAGTTSHARRFTALKYSIGGVEYDLDGLVLFDDVAFLIEGKAGGVSEPTRRGAPLDLAETLTALVGDAYVQAARALEYIRSNPTAHFESRQGPVEIRFSDLREAFLVAASLDDLSAFVTHQADLVGLGTLPPGAEVWPIYELDLRVIAELVEGGGQLVDYVSRRREIEKLQVQASDELDWFAFYLLEGMRFEETPPGQGRVLQGLLSWTAQFDDFFRYQAGGRTSPVDPPRRPLPPPVRDLMHTLEVAGPPGWTRAVAAILNAETAALEALAAALDVANVGNLPYEAELPGVRFRVRFDEGPTTTTSPAAGDLAEDPSDPISVVVVRSAEGVGLTVGIEMLPI